MYYDRKGRPIDMMEWIELYKTQHRVALFTEDRPDDTEIRISTVWLGIDHSFWGGPPIIFETMVFIYTPEVRAHEQWSRDHIKDFTLALNNNTEAPQNPFPDTAHKYHEWQRRWHTEEEALKGHDLVVKAFRENLDPDDLINAWLEEERKEQMT